MNRYLYFTVFFSGLTTLAIELSASRLLGNVFGTSNLVWAAIIGLILIYLTLGYFLGGRWADRSPHPQTMYGILAWGAFLSGLVPFFSRPVLWLAANAFDQLQMGALLGSFVSVLALFSVPVTLLGTISPFAIRLAVRDSRQAGTLSGQIYGVSTLGSFIGTYLPGLVLIPLIGTIRTFLVFSITLTLVAVVGLWRTAGWKRALLYSWMLLVLFFLIFFQSVGPVKKTAGQIYETESSYNYIQVLEQDGYRFLRLNEGQGIHSEWHPTQLDFHGPWEQFLVSPFFNPSMSVQDVKSMAIVGLAAGTTAREATAVFGPIPIDGFEIDPAIIAVGRKYFDMNEPNLNAIAQDGRWGLEHSKRRYTLIAVDAYRPPYIPAHLTTREFFQIVRDHLTENGAVAINVGRSPTDRQLIDGLAGTMRAVFPSIYVMDIPDTFNSMIFATVQPTTLADLEQNYIHLTQLAASSPSSVHPLLIQVLERFLINQQPTPDSQVVFTDDWSPIEWITNNMVLSYVFSGDVNTLR